MNTYDLETYYTLCVLQLDKVDKVAIGNDKSITCVYHYKLSPYEEWKQFFNFFRPLEAAALAAYS